MKANWSLVLNVFLLAGIVYSIVRLLRIRKKSSEFELRTPFVENSDLDQDIDDIIAVRKLAEDELLDSSESINPSASVTKSAKFSDLIYSENIDAAVIGESGAGSFYSGVGEPLMMFLSAKDDKQLAGYELLQAILASGLRFGEGELFHRHQYTNGQGTIMFSLAAATDKGTFDLQNIGSFAVKGLCLYMHLSGNPSIDEERFAILFDTAKSLSEDLDANLLDDRRKPVLDGNLNRYYQKIRVADEVVV